MNKKSQLLVCGPATSTHDSFGGSPTNVSRDSQRKNLANTFFMSRE